MAIPAHAWAADTSADPVDAITQDDVEAADAPPVAPKLDVKEKSKAASGTAPEAPQNGADQTETVPVAKETIKPAAPDTASNAENSDEDNIAVRTQKAIARVTKPPTTVVVTKPVRKDNITKVPLGSLTMRQQALRLNQIALWRNNPETGEAPTDKIIANDIWDGTVAEDVQQILPTLAMAKNPKIKTLMLHTAMSAVYSPAGMTDIDYVHWRADVLMAQKQYADAARLMNAARLGRDSATDAVRRVTYELADDDVEAACIETWALGAMGESVDPFWIGVNDMCAQDRNDDKNAKAWMDKLPDGPVKTAAATGDEDQLIAAIVKSSGFVPAPKPIADNQPLLDKLSDLMDSIQDADDPKAAAKDSKGELLLLSLGAIAAQNHGEDTDKITDQALQLAGVSFP